MLANTITKKHLPAIIKTAVGKKNIHINALANMINKNKNKDLIPVPETEITTINKKGLNLKPIVLKNQNKEIKDFNAFGKGYAKADSIDLMLNKKIN